MKLDFTTNQISNQSMKYKSSLFPDDQILSQSMRYKSNLTSSSTNEITYPTFLPFPWNPETLSCFGFLPESILPKLQFFDFK